MCIDNRKEDEYACYSTHLHQHFHIVTFEIEAFVVTWHQFNYTHVAPVCRQPIQPVHDSMMQLHLHVVHRQGAASSSKRHTHVRKVQWGKAIPLQALTDPKDSRRLRLPDFKTIGTWRWQSCQPYAPPAFTPRKYSWYSFLLEAESTPGPQCNRKDYVNEKIPWHHRESNLRPSGL
jgi:hypothetical protein